MSPLRDNAGPMIFTVAGKSSSDHKMEPVFVEQAHLGIDAMENPAFPRFPTTTSATSLRLNGMSSNSSCGGVAVLKTTSSSGD